MRIFPESEQTVSPKPSTLQKRYLPIDDYSSASPFWRYRFWDASDCPIKFEGLKHVPALDRRGGRTYRAAHTDIIPPGAHIPDPGNFGRLTIPATIIKHLRLTADDPEAWAVGFTSFDTPLILMFFPCWADARGDNLRAMFSEEAWHLESFREITAHAIPYYCFQQKISKVESLERVLAWLAQDTSVIGQENHAIVYMLTTSELSPAELVQLRWKDLELFEGTWTARFVGKGGKEAGQELYTEAVEACQQYFHAQFRRDPRPEDALFWTQPCFPGDQPQPLPYHSLGRRIKELAQAALDANVIPDDSLEVEQIYLWPNMVKVWKDRHKDYDDRLYMEIPEPFTDMRPLDTFDKYLWEMEKWEKIDEYNNIDRPLFDLWYDELANLFLTRFAYHRGGL